MLGSLTTAAATLLAIESAPLGLAYRKKRDSDVDPRSPVAVR